MRTLFLGSYGFGNLGDELCLIDAVRKFNPSEAWAFSHRPEYTRRTSGLENYIQHRHDIEDIKPERIVLGGGGVGFWPSLRDSLHWMHDGIKFGAELHIHNIGVGKISNIEWSSDERVREVIEILTSFTVRDHVSQWLVHEWKFGRSPGITYYPEYDLEPKFLTLPSSSGRLIGFSITSQDAMLAALQQNRDRIKKFIDSLGDFVAVPIVSTFQPENAQENDFSGFKFFADMFLPRNDIYLPEMLDESWWSTELTPLNLKYLISRLDLLVSQRKHNIIHAIGTGTRFVGIFPEEDDSILRIMFTLRHLVPDGSTFIALRK